jgi:sugar O-acyltransferase (sialic acid O-acetyltransferase NeuD family)
MAEKIIIIGNAIAAQIIFALLKQDTTLDIVAFSVNATYIRDNILCGKPVYALETLSEKYAPDQYQLINAIGYSNLNKNRESTFLEAKKQGFKFKNYIHPTAVILSEIVGEGVFIMPGAVIEPFSIIGANTVIWSNSVIAHHAFIQDHCWIASGCVIAGEAQIGRNSFLGVNATVVNKVSVGEYNIIGAGTLIVKNTERKAVILARAGEQHRFDSENYAKFYDF